jgi:hypothetical protein
MVGVGIGRRTVVGVGTERKEVVGVGIGRRTVVAVDTERKEVVSFDMGRRAVGGVAIGIGKEGRSGKGGWVWQRRVSRAKEGDLANEGGPSERMPKR